MDIQKLFAELGRMHLEIMQLNELVSQLRKQLVDKEQPKTETETK
jgi:hypothetical protein